MSLSRVVILQRWSIMCTVWCLFMCTRFYFTVASICEWTWYIDERMNGWMDEWTNIIYVYIFLNALSLQYKFVLLLFTYDCHQYLLFIIFVIVPTHTFLSSSDWGDGKRYTSMKSCTRNWPKWIHFAFSPSM